MRVWAEVFHASQSTDEPKRTIWENVSNDVVPVNIDCIQNTPEHVIHITANTDRWPIRKVIDVLIIQPGTGIRQLAGCFLFWKDPLTGETWGLNFLSQSDAKRFGDFCLMEPDIIEPPPYDKEKAAMLVGNHINETGHPACCAASSIPGHPENIAMLKSTSDGKKRFLLKVITCGCYTGAKGQRTVGKDSDVEKEETLGLLPSAAKPEEPGRTQNLLGKCCVCSDKCLSPGYPEKLTKDKRMVYSESEKKQTMQPSPTTPTCVIF